MMESAAGTVGARAHTARAGLYGSWGGKAPVAHLIYIPEQLKET